MELLKEIAYLSGYSGLYRIVKPARNGVIVESMDANKTRFVATGSTRVSVLKDITMYTTTEEGSAYLGDVFIAVHNKYNGVLPVEPKASGADLHNFMATVLPDYDRERVYPNDIKKLVQWYGIIFKEAPDSFVPSPVEEAENQAAAK